MCNGIASRVKSVVRGAHKGGDWDLGGQNKGEEREGERGRMG